MEKQYLAAAVSVNQEVESDNPLPSPAQSSLLEAFEQPVSLDSEKKELDEIQSAEIDAKGIQLAELSTSDLLPQDDTLMTDSAVSLQNVGFEAADRNYQSGGYSSSGYGSSAYGASSGLSGPATVGLGLVGLVAVGAALSGDSSSSSSNNSGGGDNGGGGNNGGNNTAPVISGLSQISTAEDTAVVYTVSASDADGDSLSYSITTQNNGVLTPVANNPTQFTYTPALNFNGQDSFTVSVDDGKGGITSKTVTVNVSPVNDAPVAANSQTVNAPNGDPLEVVVSASDVDGDALSYTISSLPSKGTVVAVANTPGKFVYTADDADATGSDSFVVTISDGKGGTITQKVTVNLGDNLPPELAATQAVTSAEDESVTVTVTATDPNNDELTYSISTQAGNGVVVLTDEPGVFTYTPAKDFNGSDSFVVAVSDGENTSTQTVNLTVTPVNDAPEVAATQSVQSADGKVIDITVEATDVDDDDLTYTVTTAPSNGVVVNNDDGTFTYTPTNEDFVGSDTFTVQVDDGNGGSVSQKVQIAINTDTENLTTNHNAPVSFTVTDSGSSTYAAGSADNGVIVPTSTPGKFVYYPNPGFSGSDSFDVIASDGIGGETVHKYTVSVDPAGVESSNLTTFVDTREGTAAADTYIGIVDAAAAVPFLTPTDTTLNPSDSINGGSGGVDRLVVDLRANFDGFGGVGGGGNMQGVEILTIDNTSGGVRAFNTTNVSGLTYLQLSANDRGFNFNQLADTNLVFELSDADGLAINPTPTSPSLVYNLNFNAVVNSGENDSLTLVLNDVGRRSATQGPDDGVAVFAAGIENLTVVARSGENYIDLQGISGIQKLTLGGAGDLDTLFFNGGSLVPASPLAAFSKLSTVNGSAALGDLSLSLFSAVAMSSISTGLGDDIIVAGKNIRSSTVINGGAGNDILKLVGIDDLSGASTTVTLTPNMAGVETLDLQLENTVTNFVLSGSKAVGLQKIQVSNDGGINDAATTMGTTIRDFGSRPLEIAFLEQSGETYQGNDNFTVQDSGALTISTQSENNNSSGSFADNITAVAAPSITLNIGADTTYSGDVTANVAKTASIVMGAGSTIDGTNLETTSATSIDITGAVDTQINNLGLLAQSVSNLSISGSTVINGLGVSNLDKVSNVVATNNLGGLDLTFTPATGAQSGIGAFSNSVTVRAEGAVVATTGGVGLEVEIGAYSPGNGSATVKGSTQLKNDITVGAGRNKISITGGLGDDVVVLKERFTGAAGESVSIEFGDGVGDTLTLAAGNNVLESLNSANGVDEIVAGALNDTLVVNALAVSTQKVTFTDFSAITFFGKNNLNDLINLQQVDVGAAVVTISGRGGNDTIIGTASNDIINGGAGVDTLTGGAGNNTYVYNAGDVVAGEVINFNSAGVETLRVDSSTNLSQLNGGAALTLLDSVNIAEGQTATFNSSQLTGLSTEINGVGDNGGEGVNINGSTAGDVINLSNLVIDSNDVLLTVDGGGGADTYTSATAAPVVFVHQRGDGVAKTTQIDDGANGLTAGDKLTFGNGLDKILGFKDGADFIDLDVDRANLHNDIGAFDVDAANFGLTDNGFAVIRGDFGDGVNSNVFTVDGGGDDLLFAFDSYSFTSNNAVNSVEVQFIGLIGSGGVTFDQNDIIA
ncbi:calcium-binding protein [Zhongshania marina]|uniref:Tandem-95 repeat protein n=1 Tax=Zhongshania marina TaxID=2304603 RepID=A0ABX9W3Y1_9GAMM|nr:tandem-95 repeat protein [Zhongshania marina]